MLADLRISILDQCPIAEGAAPGEGLRNALDLARLADNLGYTRYWVAEHHENGSKECASPEAFLGSIAAVTSRLRIGCGGVLLNHYSPFKVAETFSMLSNLYPDRIDLGIGRANGADAAVTLALQRDRRQPPPDDFQMQLTELMEYFAKRRAPANNPEIWLLGSSQKSAVRAAQLGLPYVFADFIRPTGATLTHAYQQQFAPSVHAASPQTAVAVWAVCAETATEAERLASSQRMMKSVMFKDKQIPVPPPETAVRFLAAGGPLAKDVHPNRRLITGTPAQVRESILKIAQEYNAQEVFILNALFDHNARLRSYELLAKSFAS